MCSMLQVLGVLLASVCLGSSGEVLRGQTTQDSGAEHRRLYSTDEQVSVVVVIMSIVYIIYCVCSSFCSCLKHCMEEDEKEKAAEEAENARKLAQEAAVQDVAEAMREADFFGPHDPGQRTEILTQRLLGTGAGFSQRDASDQAKRLLAKHSHEAGVGLRYLLSEEFASLARRRTGSEDPTFNDMKQFWLGESPIGQGVLCPRDLRAGCAMVDWIPHVHCRKQPHFMSWTWKYSLSQLQSALRTYEGVHAATFFFMCFFATTSFAFLLKAVLVPLVI